MDTEQPQLIPFANTGAVDMPSAPALTDASILVQALAPFSEQMARRQFTENTQQAFANDLKLLVDYLGPGTRLRTCTHERLEAFLYYLRHERDAPCSQRSLDRRITTLKVFFGWLARYGVVQPDPSARLVHGSHARPLPAVLSDDVVDRLESVTTSMRDADQAPDARPHLVVSLVLTTGVKKAECMRIALSDIDLSSPNAPTVFIRYTRPRQRAKSRRLPLPRDWPGTLQAYVTRYQPLARLLECTPRNVEYMFHTIAAVGGLERPVTFETLRWTYALGAYRAGVPADLLRQSLGLSKISWRETHLTLEKLDQHMDPPSA